LNFGPRISCIRASSACFAFEKPEGDVVPVVENTQAVDLIC